MSANSRTPAAGYVLGSSVPVSTTDSGLKRLYVASGPFRVRTPDALSASTLSQDSRLTWMAFLRQDRQRDAA